MTTRPIHPNVRDNEPKLHTLRRSPKVVDLRDYFARLQISEPPNQEARSNPGAVRSGRYYTVQKGEEA